MAIYQGTKLLAASVNGKSAYEAAVAGGYTGSEEEFNQILANIENIEGSIPITSTPEEDVKVWIDFTDNKLKYKDQETGEIKSAGGDMNVSVYDPQGKETDIFAYIDEHSANIPITSTPEEDVKIWIDPDEEHQEWLTGEEIAKTFAHKSEYSEVIMAAENWVNNVYSFEDTYPAEEYNVSIEIAPTATEEQYDTFSKARICGSHSGNIATAIGGAPTIDIPIIVKVVKK